MKTIAIAQARMGSTRVPGKVMRQLSGIPVLSWVAIALKQVREIDEVWIATTTEPADDAIAEYCLEHNIRCFRGSEKDVLDRYWQCVVNIAPEVVLRFTCDCPFIDPRVVSEVIRLRALTGAAYASNIYPPSYPDGLDTECFTFDALHSAWSEAIRPSDRDTVTRYIVRNQSRFPAVNLRCPLPGMEKERWVLDTEDDWKFCEALSNEYIGPGSSYIDILRVLDKNPELRTLNANHPRNERFYSQIAEERFPRRTFARSERALNRALSTIPFGAQTFSKSHLQFPAGLAPLYCSHADGAYIYDVDGHDYVDLVSALLPVILGYCDPDVDEAIRRQIDRGISVSLATEAEAELAELLCHHIPCAGKVKFGKSGTDVTTAAIRLARAVTGRDHILVGGYHGWSDWSVGGTMRGIGVPHQVAQLTHHIKYGEEFFNLEPSMIAAVIVEPNDKPEYLKWLREYCTKHGIILIFDEVITGFRYGLGGAQKLFGVTPDLACFGKAMANGMPISALVGRSSLMRRMEPPDNIFYSGTFFGETLSIAAAIATIKKLETTNALQHIWDTGQTLQHLVGNAIAAHQLEDQITLGGLPPRKLLSFKDDKVKSLFIEEMAQNGVLIINSHNLTYAHGENEIKRIVSAYISTFSTINRIISEGELDKIVPIAAAPLRAAS